MARLKQIPQELLKQKAAEFLSDFTASEELSLQRTEFNNPYIQLLWREHYVGSKGTVGRQMHYIIYYKQKAVGAISAGSAMFAHKKRDRLLSITKAEQKSGIRHIVNNTMFRLTRPKEHPPLATDVLKIWKERVKQDWLSEYGDYVRAFETLVEPPRWGGIYKLDGWRKVGVTAGLGARRPEGHGTAGKASTGKRKIIRVPKKIVWILPICSYEDAVAKSAGKASYGDEGKLIYEYLKNNHSSWIPVEAICNALKIMPERAKVSLYLMLNHDKIIDKDVHGYFRIKQKNTDKACQTNITNCSDLLIPG